jgi:dTMP kinase
MPLFIRTGRVTKNVLLSRGRCTSHSIAVQSTGKTTGKGNVAQGIFIVLEGIEGSGKSTQARLLGSWLAGKRLPHLLTREPGGTAHGEEIRRMLLHSTDMPAVTELLLMLAARATLLAELVRPALEAGKVVVADRFDISTIAYQGYGRGLPLDDVRKANEIATGGLAPDLVFLLDAPQSVGVARRAASRPGDDRIESAGRAFHDRVSEAYRLLADEAGNVCKIDATRSETEVHDAITRALIERFPETFALRGVTLENGSPDDVQEDG